MTYLDEILARRRIAVETAKKAMPVERVRAAAEARGERRDFEAALRAKRPALIAEFKRASPSAGPIAADADAASVARAYESGGAAALSVLTEPERFRGSFHDLRAARAATGLPVLCKDFIVDEYQLWEAAANGADAALLIVAALDDAQLPAFVSLARRLALCALVEVHDAAETRRALSAGARVVGINNRDLRSFRVDLETAPALRALIPSDVIAVAESGYRSAADVRSCVERGIDAVLVGESLMRRPDTTDAVRQLLAPA